MRPWNDLTAGAASLVEAAPFEGLRARMSRLLGEIEDLFGQTALGRFVTGPGIRMWQDGKSVHVESEVPGCAPADVEFKVRGSELTLKGSRKEPARPKDALIHRRERGAASFTIVVPLPAAVNADKAEMVLRNGVLTVTLPKAAAGAEPAAAGSKKIAAKARARK